MRSLRRFVSSSCLVALMLLAAACGGSRQDKISAHTDAEFDAWVADHSSVFSTEEVRELNDARQQLRFRVMTDHPGLDSDAFAQALYEQIDGHTARELLIAGTTLLVNREQVNLQNLDPMLKKFEHYNEETHLDDAKKRFVADNLERLQRETREHQEALDRYKKRLDELMKQPASP